jgi:cysteine synthase A
MRKGLARDTWAEPGQRGIHAMLNQTDVLGTIGNTPLVRLQKVVPPEAAEVWVKLEGFNPTGSYKDRMAVSIVRRSLEAGMLNPGDRVVEYTGGSTGTALAFVCAVLGLRFVAVSSNAFAPSKLAAMRAFGAEVIIEESPDGTITPELVQRMKRRAHALATEPGSFYADQFGSPHVRPGFGPMGHEIAEALDGRIDLFCAGVGTGGGLMGTLDGLASAGACPDAVAFEPAQSPFLTTGKGGPHRVEGTGVGFEPPFLERSRLKEARTVDQELAFDMCRRLAREEGIFGGTSTGMNVVGAIQLATELGPEKRVVTLGCDNGIKYLGGPLFA